MGETYRLLLNENLEYEVLEWLVGTGHDVEHIDTIATLDKARVIASWNRPSVTIAV